MSYAIHNKDRTFQNLDYVKRQLNMLYEESIELKQDNIRLQNIIKEVREELNKIDSATYQGDTDKKTYYKYEQTRIQELLEILDKENKC